VHVGAFVVVVVDFDLTASEEPVRQTTSQHAARCSVRILRADKKN
jgi:hypothetical protein